MLFTLCIWAYWVGTALLMGNLRSLVLILIDNAVIVVTVGVCSVYSLFRVSGLTVRD